MERVLAERLPSLSWSGWAGAPRVSPAPTCLAATSQLCEHVTSACTSGFSPVKRRAVATAEGPPSRLRRGGAQKGGSVHRGMLRHEREPGGSAAGLGAWVGGGHVGQGSGGTEAPLGARLAVECLQDSQLARACRGGLGGPSTPAAAEAAAPSQGQTPHRGQRPSPCRQPLPPHVLPSPPLVTLARTQHESH